MAGVSTSIPNVVRILLKTNIKRIKIALSSSNTVDSTGCVSLNINTGLTWDNLFKNLNLPVAAQLHVVRGGDKKSRIVEANLTEKISQFVGNFERKKLYTARIEMASIKKTSFEGQNSFVNAAVGRNTTTTCSSPNKRSAESANLNQNSAKKRRGRPPKNLINPVPLAARSATINAPVAAHINTNVQPKKPSQIRSKDRPSTSNGLGATNNNNASSNSPCGSAGRNSRNPVLLNPFLNDNGNVEEDENEVDEAANDDCETESQLSVFTQKNHSRSNANQQGGNNSMNNPNPNVDVKAAVIESLMKNLSNSVLWRMKKEVDELKNNGKWIKLIQYIPRVGHLISEVFDEKHFTR